MSKLTTNTADLQAILDKVNALPDAGSDGGGNGSAEIKTGELTLTKSLSSPGYYDYKLTADGFTPTEYNILIIYANETYRVGGIQNSLLAVVWGELALEGYDKTFLSSGTIIAPKNITIMPDYVVLVETGDNTSSAATTRNSINYYAI